MGNLLGRPVLQADLDCSDLTELHAKLRERTSPNAPIRVKKGDAEQHWCTPLAYALVHRDLACVEALLGHGADPNKEAGFNAALALKPLHISAALGKLPELSSLLAHGADPNCKTSLRIFKPSTSSFVPGANFFHTTGGDTALHIAIDGGHVEIVNTLLQQPSVDVNCQNDRKRTPLYKACKRNNMALATCLTQHAAIDVNTGAPIFAAINSKSHDLMGLLLHEGASLHATNDAGQTPMEYLVTFFSIGFWGRANMILQLQQAGGDVNCIVQPGCSALDFAINNKWERVVTTLRSCGALTYSELQKQNQREPGHRPPKKPAPVPAPKCASSSGPKIPEPSQAKPVPKTVQSQSSASGSASRAPEPVLPSAPPLSTGPQTGLCCVCLAAPAVLGFVHASVIHNCLCEGCKAELQGSRRGLRTCLVCNSAASGVIRVVGT